MLGRQEPFFGKQEAPSASEGATIRLAPIDQVLGQHAAIISRIRLAAGITTHEFDGHYMRAIRAYAAYVQTLPASRSRHHTEHGGMLAYGLETAFLALQIAGNKIFSAHEPVETRSKVEIRWRLAAFLTGLFADIGLVAAVVVYAKNGDRWEPLIEPITAFANRHNTSEVLHHWRNVGDPTESENRVYSGLILPRLLDQEHLTFLLDGGRHIIHALALAVAGQTNSTTTNALLQTIDEARAASIAKDDRSRGQLPIKASLHLPLHQYLLDAMRRLARNGWTANADAGPLWKAKTGVYLDWAKATETITALLNGDGLVVPQDPDTLAEILADHNVLIRSPNVGQRQAMYWQCWRPDGSPMLCIRIDPMILGTEKHEDIELHIEPDPNPIVLHNELSMGSTDSTSVYPGTNSLSVGSMASEPQRQVENLRPGSRPTPSHRHFDFKDEGPEGNMLLALATNIANGRTKFDDVVAQYDDKAAILFPDAITQLGFKPEHMLQKLSHTGWLIQPQKGKGSGWLHEFGQPKWGKAKTFILNSEISQHFLELVSERNVNQQSVVRELATSKMERTPPPAASSTPVNTAPESVAPANTHTILVAIDAAFRDGEFDGQRIEVLVPNESPSDKSKDYCANLSRPRVTLRMPFPLTYEIAARRLSTTIEHVTKVLTHGPALRKGGTHPVRNDGTENYVLFDGSYLSNIVTCSQAKESTGKNSP